METTETQNRGVYRGSGEYEVFEKSAETAESGKELNASSGGDVSLVAALRDEEIKRRLEEAKAVAARMSMFAARYRSAIKCYMEKLMETMSRSMARKRVAEVIKNEDVEELRRAGCL
jgi:acyl-CoA reductase-like NAD-dependent aldehyde dehydrogenase